MMILMEALPEKTLMSYGCGAPTNKLEQGFKEPQWSFREFN